MANRQAEKERLRREREERERIADAKFARRRTITYSVGGAVALILIVAIGFALFGGSEEGPAKRASSGTVLPGDGEVPATKETDLKKAAKAAKCKLISKKADGVQSHETDLNKTIKYKTNPPSFGRHYIEPAEDGAYETAPDVKKLVHELEHGRIIIWFKEGLPRKERANLKALFDEDDYQMVLTPNETDMPYEVAATAWNREPLPGGTGRVLGCKKYNDEIFDALRDFRDKHRGNGPEAVQ